MKIVIVTQKEFYFMPNAVASLVDNFSGEVTGIIVSSATSTHGSFFSALRRHVALFGIIGFLRLVARDMVGKLASVIYKDGNDGYFYSIESVAKVKGIPYNEVEKFNNDQSRKLFASSKAEVLVSISCPLIIGRKIRAMFPKGAVNSHSAPLPKYRGLMPNFWVLLNEEKETAVSIHELADKIDDGAILMQKPIPIESEETWSSLVKKCKVVSVELIIEYLKALEKGEVVKLPNDDEHATYNSFPTRADRKKFLSMGRRFF